MSEIPSRKVLSLGPWCVGDQMAYGTDIRSADHRNLWVGTANSSHGGNDGFPSDEDTEAIANLMAAAPDMYRALHALLDASGSVMSGIPHHQADLIDKAVALAEGRSRHITSGPMRQEIVPDIDPLIMRDIL